MRHSPAHGFFFVHVPKNAGTSVAQALGVDARRPDTIEQDLARHAITPLPGRYPWCVRHSALGDIHLEHIPLSFLAACFPLTHDLLRRSESFVILRDPRERFVSAVMQRLREVGGHEAGALSPGLIRREASEVVGWLAGRDDFCDLDHIHFTRQSAYVEQDGERIIRHCFRIDRLDALCGWMADRFGVTMAVPRRDNPALRPAPWLGLLPGAAITFYKRMIPLALRERLSPGWRKAGLLRPIGSHRHMRLPDDVEAFIESHYRADRALFEHA